MSKLDRYDLSILAELQRDARISNQELAERIGLSPSHLVRAFKARTGLTPQSWRQAHVVKDKPLSVFRWS